MKRLLCLSWAGAAALMLGGCMTGPLQENPILLKGPPPTCGNPVFVPFLAYHDVYGSLFEKVLSILTDFNFDIDFSNRYSGEIQTFPVTSPGIGQPWKGGSPDFYHRLLATCQSMRHRALVKIEPARDGGYWVSVQVLNELDSLAAPTKAVASAVAFRSDISVERQFEVVGPGAYETNWIPVGHDVLMEQAILDRIAHINLAPPPPSKSWFAWFSSKEPAPTPTPAPLLTPAPAPAPAAAPAVPAR